MVVDGGYEIVKVIVLSIEFVNFVVILIKCGIIIIGCYYDVIFVVFKDYIDF